MPIPEWNDIGALPPFRGRPTSAMDRSPYPATLAEVVGRFGDSPERRRLLSGLLAHRAELHQAGLVSGFQWLDGSFAEDIEWLEGREPKDVDVVTFYRLPDGGTEEPPLGDLRADASQRGIDAHFVPMDPAKMEEVAAASAYWNSVWGHRRDGQWKGYLQVDLSRDEDENARRALDARAAEESRR